MGLLQMTHTPEKLLRLEIFPNLYDGVNLKKMKGVLDDPNYSISLPLTFNFILKKCNWVFFLKQFPSCNKGKPQYMLYFLKNYKILPFMGKLEVSVRVILNQFSQKVEPLKIFFFGFILLISFRQLLLICGNYIT